MNLTVIDTLINTGLKISGLREVTKTCLLCRNETGWGISGWYGKKLAFRFECANCGEVFCCMSKEQHIQPWMQATVFNEFEEKALARWSSDLSHRRTECQKLIVGTPPPSPDPLLMLGREGLLKEQEEKFWEDIENESFQLPIESAEKTITEPPTPYTDTTIICAEDSVSTQQPKSQTQNTGTSSLKKRTPLSLSGILTRIKVMLFG